MKLIQLMSLLLIFFNVQSKNLVFFLDGRINNEYKKRHIKKFIKKIKKEYTVKTFKIKKNHLRLISKNRKRLIDEMKEQTTKINIIATGYGIPLLNELLTYFHIINKPIIDKAIIIGKRELFQDKSIVPYYYKKKPFEDTTNHPIREVKIAITESNKKGFKLIDSMQKIPEDQLSEHYSESSGYYTENFDDSAKISDYYTQSSSVEFADNELEDTISSNEKLNDKIILIPLDLYQKPEKSCLGFCTINQFNTVIGLASLTLSILAAL